MNHLWGSIMVEHYKIVLTWMRKLVFSDNIWLSCHMSRQCILNEFIVELPRPIFGLNRDKSYYLDFIVLKPEMYRSHFRRVPKFYIWATKDMTPFDLSYFLNYLNSSFFRLFIWTYRVWYLIKADDLYNPLGYVLITNDVSEIS